MPMLEMRCLLCGRKFEKIIWKTDELIKIECPFCKSYSIEKLISSFAFKGGSRQLPQSKSCSSNKFS
jgi:putative FmdB family regulatory protein